MFVRNVTQYVENGLRTKKYDENSLHAKEYNNTHWYYAGILIPNTIKKVICRDQINYIGPRSCTEAFSKQQWTVQEYQELHGQLGMDGKLYWKC